MAPLADSEEALGEEAQAYYASITSSGLDRSFANLDDVANLDGFMTTVQGSDTKNLVLDFSETSAWVSCDLSASTVDALIEAERPLSLNTRWINIWYPHHQKSLLELIAKHYDFSPRLLALMISDPKHPKGSQSTLSSHKPSRPRRPWSRHSRSHPTSSDVETRMDELSEHSSISSYDSVARGNLYEIISDLWHYSSIDFGRSYVCIGYNSLYGTKHPGEDKEEGLLPHCTRVWTWLILCKDNTVISINEDPFPFSAGRLDHFQQRVLAETRRNLVNVFHSLSLADEGPLMAQKPMALLPIRARLGDTPEETVHRESNAPGLLFYYLFENWHNNYTLVTRRESRYGVQLNKLRAEMFESPKLCHVDRLDTIGKELGVLKRHYESYNRLIDRLLEPQMASTASLQNSRVVSEASQGSLDTIRPLVTEKESMLGVSLSSAARVRFTRLRDLIDLYALSEVEEYIKQKDSLVAMVSPPHVNSPRPFTSTSDILTYHATTRISTSSPSKNPSTSNA